MDELFNGTGGDATQQDGVLGALLQTVGEHGMEVVTARCQHHPVGRELLPLGNQRHVKQLAAVSQVAQTSQEMSTVMGLIEHKRFCVANTRCVTSTHL